jgi:murein DD-endopeptidase MepM/ murein hydrolase activator NlpD
MKWILIISCLFFVGFTDSQGATGRELATTDHSLRNSGGQSLTEGGAFGSCSGECKESIFARFSQLNKEMEPLIVSQASQGVVPRRSPSPASSTLGGFIHPLPGSRQTSGFGLRRSNLGGVQVREFHTGVDYQLGFRAPVRAAKSGVVLRSVNHCGPRSTGCGGGYGNHVIIDHEDGTFSLYAHLDRECSPFRGSGQTLRQGQVLGCVGNSGSVRGRTGIHLHFEIRQTRPSTRGVGGAAKFFGATPVDPRRFIGLG